MKRVTSMQQSLKTLESLGWEIRVELCGRHWSVWAKHVNGQQQHAHGTGSERGLCEALEWMAFEVK